ncbi:flagellin [Pedococcus sp. KACC 23699]|uniref:Flagellin n=1 Tax=Pedococcus sp. KACC 23699 TaxID=3149228 RepID=A0AAU7JZ12_9MICO
MEGAQDRIPRALERVGNSGNAVDSAMSAADKQALTLTQAKSDLVDTDIAKATMDMQLSSLSYQAALAAVSKSNLPSLADYLR